ncbi:hypothetical protein FZD47_02440 [Bacillus infantis]|uniref:DUF7210 domain-containing protein n=1 Tax=Bacillus infantis TaxID=324767 RepID=A0A5D4SSK9_9BACI|nr:hypothetical protein [Bacillus infantis]TYS66365.1 hypothetical protein FZD47_02440 [Bacillus infantis]
MMAIKATEYVQHDGTLYKSGEKISKISESEAKRLVKLGAAFFVGEEQSSTMSAGGEAKPSGDLAKELDDKFTLDTLKIEAEAFEVNFSKSVKKPELINLIIESGVAEDILETLENGE